MQKFTSVDEYISKAPVELQDKLRQLRLVIKTVASSAIERISYGMPFYEYHKQRLVYFAYAKKHIGVYALFPDSKTLQTELKGYSTSKGTIRFPLDQDLPLSLIKKLIQNRMKLLNPEG